jgi:hypothetical protein
VGAENTFHREAGCNRPGWKAGPATCHKVAAGNTFHREAAFNRLVVGMHRNERVLWGEGKQPELPPLSQTVSTHLGHARRQPARSYKRLAV